MHIHLYNIIFFSEDSKLIMQTIWLRLADSGKNWRHVYKGLQLIEFLVGHGAERIIDECKDNINIVRSLKNFQYMDEKNKDVGQQVRELAVKTAKLLADDASIVDMRKAAKKTKGKFEGISAEESRFHKSRGAYDEDTEQRKKPSKYDDSEQKNGDDEEAVKPKKKKSYTDDDDDNVPAKKPAAKNDDEFDAKFDDDEDAPAPVAKQVNRPRAASGGKQPTPVAKPQPQQQQTNNGLLDIDSFIGGPAVQQQTKQQQQAAVNYYMTPQVIDPFETPKPIAQPTNTATLNNAFDDNWDAQWQEGADQQSQNQQHAEDSKPKNELFGFASGLVNFDTLDDKKKPQPANSNSNQTALQQQQQQAKTKSMAELKAEKGGMIQPRQMTPAPTTFVPTTAPAPQFGTRPATGFGTNPYPQQPQPNPYGMQPNPYGTGYPQQQPQPNPYGMQPNPAFRGYPQQPQPQQPMGRGNPNFNAFNF